MLALLDEPTPQTAAPPPSRRHQRDRSARQALAWGLCLFIFSQGALALTAETWFPALRDPTFWSRVPPLKARLQAAQPESLSVLMFGSSCTVFGFHGQIVERETTALLNRPVVAYNFGYYGRGPLTHLINLERLLREGMRPNLVLVEVFPVVFSARIPETDKQGTLMQYADLATLGQYQDPERMRNAWLRATLVPVSANRTAILSGTVPRLLRWNECPEWWRDVDASGWRKPLPTSKPPDAVQVRRITTEWTKKLGKLEVGGEAERALDQLLALCRQEDIAVGLVQMPEGPLMRGLYPPGKYEAVGKLVARMQARHRVPVLDARAWLEEDEFMDSHHQLECGAIKFSVRLARDFATSLLRAQADSRNRSLISVE